MRHRLLLAIADLGLIALATIAAQSLRDNFETRPEQFWLFLPYLGLTIVSAVPALAVFGLDRGIWRLSGLPDYLRVAGTAILTVVSAVALGFLINRLEGVARSLPIMQGILIAVSLVGVRVAARLRHAKRRSNLIKSRIIPEAGETILVVGVDLLAELYLRALAEFAAGRVKVAGLLGPKERHAGRLIQEYQILGPPEQIGSILRDLEVHGVFVDRIVIALAFDKLLSQAQEALLDIEKTSSIRLEFLAETLASGNRSERSTGNGPAETSQRDKGGLFSADELATFSQRPYWAVKRALDAVAAACALIVLAPVLFFLTVLVAIDVGLPAIFWQQRPGAGGHPIRLFKFRTMGAAHDSQGRRVADAQRLSLIGYFMRRSRLDELPQLYNVLIGEMSFIGPRPLLPADQFPALLARLTIRPGITGWAQVKGGREISASDKAALDVWYVKHGSVRIDLAIIASTVRMILFGERVDRDAIRLAWRELDCERTTICGRPLMERRPVDESELCASNGGMGRQAGANKAA